jgi:hypothetical protein
MGARRLGMDDTDFGSSREPIEAKTHGSHARPCPQFAREVARQLRVLEVDQCRLPPRLPALNGILERTVKSLRWELLDHIRVATVEQANKKA